MRVPDNRVLRIFEPERDEVIGGCRNLHNEEIHNLYTLRSRTRIKKWKRMRWAKYVICMRIGF
jgi:hypothetical protein